MKKIQPKSDTLLVLCSASLGGPTSSAINLLQLFREQGRPFDVFLMDHNDVRTSEMAKQGNLLPCISFLSDAITNKKNIKTPMQFIRRVNFVISHKLFGADRARRWVYKAAARKLSNKYKNVLAYQESIATDFARYIDAPNRVGWMHTDYDKLRSISPRAASREIYDNFNHIASVTKASADRIVEVLGRESSTVHVIRNPLIPQTIVERSKETIPVNEQKKKSFLIVSVGRLSPEKAFHLIPKAGRRLVDDGIDFDWYIIGEGAAREQIEDEIKRTGTNCVVHLLGSKMNPYPYIRMADVLVITSEYEAQPMVANEALILDTPVISTEFASVREVILDGINGMIVKHDPDAIAECIGRFVSDGEIRSKLTSAAERFEYDNKSILTNMESLLI